MRIKNMYLLCRKYLNFLNKFKLTDCKNSDNKITHREIPEFSKFVDMINELGQIECLTGTCKSIIGTLGDSIMHNHRNLIYSESYNDFIKFFNLLREKTKTIVDLGDSIGFEDIENGFDIKLPSNLTLSEMSNCIRDLDKVFNQCPLLNTSGEKITFKSVDVGSVWFEFLTIATGTSLILYNLAAIVDKCVKIASHIKTVNLQKEFIKSSQMDNELKETMINGFSVMIKQLVENSSKELQKEMDNTLDPDSNERLKLSLHLISDWMAKGMEIYSSLQAPQEVKDLFPSASVQKQIDTPTVLLEDKEKCE